MLSTENGFPAGCLGAETSTRRQGTPLFGTQPHNFTVPTLAV